MNKTPDDLPPFAKALGVIGPQTVDTAHELLLPLQRNLFGDEIITDREDEGLKSFVRTLIDPAAAWSDEQAAALLRGCAERKLTGNKIDFGLAARWIANHPNDYVSVLQCLDVEPPDEVDIVRVLSRAGSQKVVYLASWRSMQKEVVLKRTIRTDGAAVRDMESFPLNLSHPNIIETHPLRNANGELFFAESRLAEVLHDGWEAQGIQDTANLLYDIASALKYLHDHKRVHGDVKPDNIGKDAGEYILLDFGICRSTEEFMSEATATGSLRTRAPELLTGDGYVLPPKVDVWALGATLFNACCRRFPLTRREEIVPRISAPREREEFEKMLQERVNREWESLVNLSELPEVFRGIVGAMLERNPTQRIDSGGIIERAAKELPAFIRGLVSETVRSQRFSPVEELGQLITFFEGTKVELIPRHKIAELIARLRELQGTPGFSSREQTSAQTLLSRLI